MKPGWNASLKKWLLFVLALCLIAPQAALAEDGAAVPRWNFIDMGDGHWATKHVRKIGLLGITSGDDQGRYNPTQNITREQAVLMVVNLLGLQEEAKANTVQVNLGFHVSNWAEMYVKYAVVKELIDLQEESGNVRENPLTNVREWGTLPASREWIAKLVVKALGKGAEAAERDSEYTGFADDAAISDGFAGYVMVAKELGLMVGDNNRFNPTAPITRAEMAVVFGKMVTMLPAANPRVVTGTLEAVTQSDISLLTPAGSVTYPLAAGAVFYTHEHNNPILPSSLTRGDAIFLIQYGGTAYYVEKTVQTVRYETIVGEFLNIYTDTSAGQPMRIAVLVDGEPRAYPFAPGVTTFTAEDGTGLSLSDLTEGSLLELYRVAGTEQITRVVVKKIAEKETVYGTIEETSSNRFVAIRDRETGKKTWLQIPENVKIVSDSREIDVADLHVGDEVAVELKDGTVTELVVTKSVITTMAGEVQSIDEAGKIITILDANHILVSKFLDSKVTVSISGISSARLSDVQKGDHVLLELNAGDKVQKIIVQNRTVDARMQVTFDSYRDDYNTLFFISGDKKLESLELSNNTAVDYKGAAIKPAQINERFKKGDKIDLVISGGRVVSMRYSKSYTGVIVDISARSNTITLDEDEFGRTTFSYTYPPYVLAFGKSGTLFGDLRVGDRVRLELDDAQANVQFVHVMQERLFKVKEKLSYKLIVTDLQGTSYDIGNVSGARITHYDKLYAGYADIEPGSFITVSFDGTLVTEIRVHKASYGVVENLDAPRNAFAFAEYGQTARTVSAGGAIWHQGKLQSSLSFLKKGDRIHLVEADGVLWIDVLTKEEKKVNRYIANTKTIQFIVKTLDEENLFPLDDSVYIHHNGTVLQPTSLKMNDVVNVYFHNGKIVEIEKR